MRDDYAPPFGAAAQQSSALPGLRGFITSAAEGRRGSPGEKKRKAEAESEKKQ